MSNALAVAATMRVIASLLDSGVGNASLASLLGAALTTVHPPDLVPIGDSVETDHLNLFLYTVTMNSGWRNIATTRNSAGDRVGRPPLAVDLHFLLSAYGANQYHPELLLGIGMQVLHEQPFLDRNGIRSLFGIAASPEDQAMATAELDQQIEQIKISPHDLSADELYKLWSAFGSKCRPSAAYVATVVLIDSKAEVKSAPPARGEVVATGVTPSGGSDGYRHRKTAIRFCARRCGRYLAACNAGATERRACGRTPPHRVVCAVSAATG
jgi:hypothetical protein